MAMTRTSLWHSLFVVVALLALGAMECVSLYQIDALSGAVPSSNLIIGLKWLALPLAGLLLGIAAAAVRRVSLPLARVALSLAALCAGVYMQRFTLSYRLGEMEALIGLTLSLALCATMLAYGGLWKMPLFTAQLVMYVYVLMRIELDRPAVVYYFYGLSVMLLMFVATGNRYAQRVQAFGQDRERALDRMVSDELLDLRNEWRQLIRKDELTSLPNQAGFAALLRHDWNRCFYSQEALTLLLVDIDLLALYNKCYGTVEGDRCVRCIARVLEEFAERGEGTAARLEDGAFALLLSGLAREEVPTLADRIRVAVDALHIPHDMSLVSEYVTISVGWAQQQPAIGATTDKLMQAAARALQVAKFGGRNRVECDDARVA